MDKIVSSKLNVFISYSWDSKEHQQWVISLADVINIHGGNAIVDRKHLKYGGHIKTFMLKSILEADIVLIILTPNYKQKADSLEGGAGYEYNIINDELFKIMNSNEKFIPIIRAGTFQTSTTHFLQGFNCVDLRDGDSYDQYLKELLDQIFNTNANQTISKDIKISTMEEEYKDIPSIIKEVKERTFRYFQNLFVTEDKLATKKNLTAIAKEWADQIEEYHSSFVKKFSPNKMEIYEEQLEDFKNNVFGKQLWTVKAALKTPDPDLARYKKDFRNADPVEVFDTVNGILNAAHSYNESIITNIDYTNLSEVSELKMEFLNEEDMFMNKVIGFGIRSEILHRYFPALFPIMTQPSLWAMYFICENNYEFITIEKRMRESIMRVSHNWQYPYDRFSFIMNVIANELFNWFANYDIKLNPSLRFGYVNMLLSSISDFHKQDTRLLHEWVDAR
ncbi:TIR domain-containing protein [Flavobacterium sp. D11R37]|uniref:toll/interleukin-1 receptor domain-containing protein n=1 Tax=Flavobacterium coralii TaxID=2838017 RepID=UPI001CA75CC5|nr:toll/interleukin-1 receptor domain-containing protein [Flavobacterium coralii]MBY8964011.1 TIR domain-containing protein [Flavobacterium coralii]